MGIDTAPLREWAEKVLDSGDTVFLPRTELETLRKQASATEAPRFYLQVKGPVSVDAAKSLRESVKRWQNDPSEVLILGEGVELRAIAEVVADPSVATVIPEDETIDIDDLIEGIKSGAIEAGEARVQIEKAVAANKAGRRVSAATKAKLMEAMGHHETLGKCIKDIMDGDGPDDEAGDDPDAQPPGTVVAESDEHLSPEERRLKEVRELRASLPPKN